MNARGAMTRDFPPVLARMISRLGSPFDGEVVATARAIGRILKSKNRDWNDLAAGVTALTGTDRSCDATYPSRGPPLWADLDNLARLQWLAALASEPGLNDWSRSFVTSIAGRLRAGCRLSPKQAGCVDKILAAGWRRGVRVNERRRA